MFEFAKDNANDHCKRMAQCYLTLDDDLNSIDNEILHDTLSTDSIALIKNYNAGTEQQVNSESDEPMFVDPGVEEDSICSWFKSRKIPTFEPHKIK